MKWKLNSPTRSLRKSTSKTVSDNVLIQVKPGIFFRAFLNLFFGYKSILLACVLSLRQQTRSDRILKLTRIGFFMAFELLAL